jgi:choline dehydrogenase-like flavoprotein
VTFQVLTGLASGRDLDADLCIVGAGMAGLSVARALSDMALRVCIVESGGFTRAESAQALSGASNCGPHALDLLESRPRVFGGSSQIWGSFCCPLDAGDFAARPSLPLRTWPIGLDELEAYYRAAQKVLGLGPPFFDDRLWAVFGEPAPRFYPSLLRTRFWQFRSTRLFPFVAPLRFGEAFRTAFAAARDALVVLNCTAVRIVMNERRDRVTGIEVRGEEQGAARINARAYLLAGGAIENARLLMVSGFGADGCGRMLGRCFADHPHVTVGTVRATDVPALLDRLAIRRRRAGVVLQPAICPSPEFQSRSDVLNASISVEARAHEDCATTAFAVVARALVDGQMPPDLARNFCRIARDPTALLANFYRRAVHRSGVRPRVRAVELFCRSEQEPNPDSRLTLDGERDRLGVPRVKLDWRLSERDRRSVVALTRAVGEEFARLRLGEVIPASWLAEPSGWPDDLRGGPHHAGTTRMADHAADGVVNRDCRVHGVDNLYAAGTSVFATAGYANPAMTVVALALRTADHLRGRFAAGAL